MKHQRNEMNSESWTGHTEPIDRFVLVLVLLAGAIGFLIVGIVVL